MKHIVSLLALLATLTAFAEIAEAQQPKKIACLKPLPELSGKYSRSPLFVSAARDEPPAVLLDIRERPKSSYFNS